MSQHHNKNQSAYNAVLVISVLGFLLCVLVKSPLLALFFLFLSISSIYAKKGKISPKKKSNLSKQEKIIYNEGCPFSSEIPEINDSDCKRTYLYTDVSCEILKETYPLKTGSVVYTYYDGIIHDIFNNEIAKIQNDKLCSMINDYIKRGDSITARVSSCKPTLKINIGFYRNPQSYSMSHYLSEETPHKIYKLVGNRKDEYQESISLCSEGESVSIDCDWEHDRYVASCSGDIGFFPSSADSELEGDYRKFPAYIDHIKEDDNGIYSVYVIIFFPD